MEHCLYYNFLYAFNSSVSHSYLIFSLHNTFIFAEAEFGIKQEQFEESEI